jgi:hypothetical protein
MKIVSESQLNFTRLPLPPSRFDLNRQRRNGSQANAITSVDSLLIDSESKPEGQAHFGESHNIVDGVRRNEREELQHTTARDESILILFAPTLEHGGMISHFLSAHRTFLQTGAPRFHRRQNINSCVSRDIAQREWIFFLGC